MEKAKQVLDKALVTLEAYDGPSYTVACLTSAQRTGIFLYEILALLADSQNVIWECKIMILNEPWMKANSIAMATFEFLSNEEGFISPEGKLVMKRKKSIKYYKNTEMLFENTEEKEEKENIEETTFELVTDV